MTVLAAALTAARTQAADTIRPTDRAARLRATSNMLNTVVMENMNTGGEVVMETDLVFVCRNAIGWLEWAQRLLEAAAK